MPVAKQISVLSVDGLSVSFRAMTGWTRVLHDVSFEVMPGEILAVVGESGSGKSVTSLAVMGLLGATGRIDAGAITLGGTDLATLAPAAMRRLRGHDMAMIFQEPGTSLNPVLRVGDQIAEAMTEHGICDPETAQKRAVELMDRVGIPAAATRARDYPHQLSGGMKQRVMIAMALSCGPKLLIADEPTTALDVTIQAQILNLLLDLRDEFGMAVLLITHDMGVVAQVADRVAVMYAGQVVETAQVADLFATSAHPYAGLLTHSIPSARRRQAQLPSIAGTTPPPQNRLAGCRFGPRCPLAIEPCHVAMPALASVAPGHLSRCIRAAEVPALLAGRRELVGA